MPTSMRRRQTTRRSDRRHQRPIRRTRTIDAPVLIREIVDGDRVDWLRMREALWPGSLADHDLETRAYFERSREQGTVFVAEIDGRVAGFLELEYRKYAPGCRSSPVPFIEGWYVEPELRGRGIGKALIDAAEAHARTTGYDEIASDAELENTGSLAAHRALGYEEIERVVSFRKSLRDR
jgi:aminoglycoside 6'-N-acetyltransferase I